VSIKGRVFQITNTNATDFFTSILLNDSAPTTGFAPLMTRGLVATLRGSLTRTIWVSVHRRAQERITVTSTADVSSHDGTFEFQDFPSNVQKHPVSITLTLRGLPYYRSASFAYDRTQHELNIYVYQPTVPRLDGITAGEVSQAIQASGASLPGNVTLSASPNGIGVSGSEDEASVKFGMQIWPDTSSNLGIFFELSLISWNIQVGFPDDLCESADDILDMIEEGLLDADSTANSIVLDKMTGILTGPPLRLPASTAAKLLSRISIQLSSVSYANSYAWAVSDTDNSTIVVVPQPIIGYPRGW
jgi:hypothetical protein